MKLASLKSGRDGRLVVVNDLLTMCVPVPDIAQTLQDALDDWARTEPRLRDIAEALNAERHTDAVPFDIGSCAAPLPRAYQWADGSAYVSHMELVRKARGAELPESYWHDPVMYQGGSDTMLGPRDDIVVGSEEYGIDLEAEVAVIVDDVPMGVTPQDAKKHIKLVMICNDVSLRGLIPGELQKGFGFFHGKPPTAFSAVAVTPDSLDSAWDGGKLCRPMLVEINGERLGEPEAGEDMVFDFPALIAYAAKTRPLGAGTIVGSGTISNREGVRGYACLAEIRMAETIAHGAPKTPFLRFGDRVHIDMHDRDGNSIFGSIDQIVRQTQDLM
jgi:fumarylacetoacetate (FAA) hydrolase